MAVQEPNGPVLATLSTVGPANGGGNAVSRRDEGLDIQLPGADNLDSNMFLK